jgi:DNA-binding transcriptional ArsR family regulator
VSESPAATGTPPPIRRGWVFGGDERAWDVLADAMVRDPAAAVPWPISAVGPSTEPGDRVLLWRSGADGGIAAVCEVVDEEEPPVVTPDGRRMSSVRLRVHRALARPIPATRLARVDVLRPIAFFDLLRVPDHRLTPEQDRAIDDLMAEELVEAPDDESMATIRIPSRILPLVEELVEALDGGERRPAPPTPRAPRAPRMRTTPTVRADAAGRRGPAPERLAAELAGLGAPFADDAFTSAELASALGVDVSAARSRLRALTEAGLVEETDRGGPRRDADGRPMRGRPPTRYRLAGREDAAPEHIATI